MLKALSNRAVGRALILSVPAAIVAAIVVGPGFAGAATPSAAGIEPTGKTDKIEMVLEGNKLKFTSPGTVTQGDDLEVINKTDAKQVGPHTISFVEKSLVPLTKKARQSCFTPKHICLTSLKWFGVKGEEPPKINPVEAGPDGWSTAGSLTKTGDAWFTSKKGQTLTQEVTAEPGTLYYICIVHPFMHGKITVKPAAS